MATNALHAIAIKAFRDRLASLGIDPLEVMETASRGRGATASAQSPPTAHEVLETAVAISGDTALAIKIGNGLDLASYGTYGFALMSCSDMGAALELEFACDWQDDGCHLWFLDKGLLLITGFITGQG